MAFLFYFEAVNYLNSNGKLLPKGSLVLPADSRGYRYGDGLFETMKIRQGAIQLASYHFERLFSGLETLKFTIPSLWTRERIQNEITELCNKNGCLGLGRIRLSVSRGNGGLYDDDRNLQYLIEAWPLRESVNNLNENGLVIDIYPDARKSCDRFSHLKSANFLPYSMAAVFARENQLNDCLVLNAHGRICDATIANIFIIKGEKLITPPLSEGPVSGVMRRKILESQAAISDLGLMIEEIPLEPASLMEADELFLSNSVNGIRWVQRFREKNYASSNTHKIFRILDGHGFEP